MSGIFRFKQFSVDQTASAMKINTDGVVLGAIAYVDHPARILDVGTGTGVIALMLAQRFSGAVVDAIDIDPIAADLAKRNFTTSPFSDRLRCHQSALQRFEADVPYDLIVSNPPFFIGALKNADIRKQVARHTDLAFFDDLLERATQWLTPGGSLQLILPVALADIIERRIINEHGLLIQGQVDVRSFTAQEPIRRILAIGKRQMPHRFGETDLIIYESKGVYSQRYRELLRDFFLAF